MRHPLTAPDLVTVKPLITLIAHEPGVERTDAFADEILARARPSGRGAVKTSADGVQAEQEAWPSPFTNSHPERLAARQLEFQDLRIVATATGGSRLVGVAVNKTHRRIHWATIAIEYLVNGAVVLRENFPWGPMSPYEQRRVGVLLRPIAFDSVRVVPLDVHLRKPETPFSPRNPTVLPWSGMRPAIGW